MKPTSNLLLAISAMAVLVTGGCKKEAEKEKVKGCTDPAATNFSSSAEEDNGTCHYLGKVTFWTSEASGLCNATIIVGGFPYTRQTHGDFASEPACGAENAATYEIPAGTYEYNAFDEFCDGSTVQHNWDGVFTVTEKGCKLIELVP